MKLRSRLHIFGYGTDYANDAAVVTATLKQPGWIASGYAYWDNPANFGTYN